MNKKKEEKDDDDDEDYVALSMEVTNNY